MWEVTQTIQATVGYPHLSTKKVTNKSYVGFKNAPDIVVSLWFDGDINPILYIIIYYHILLYIIVYYYILSYNSCYPQILIQCTCE